MTLLDLFLWTLVGAGCFIIAALALAIGVYLVIAMAKAALKDSTTKLKAVR